MEQTVFNVDPAEVSLNKDLQQSDMTFIFACAESKPESFVETTYSLRKNNKIDLINWIKLRTRRSKTRAR